MLLWNHSIGANAMIDNENETTNGLLTIFACTTGLTANPSLRVCSIEYNIACSIGCPSAFACNMNDIFM